MASTDLELVRGTFDLLILKTLSWGPMHGLGVLRWIEGVTENRLQIEEGALYPALHRLEQRGWIDAEWGYSESNRRGTTSSSPSSVDARPSGRTSGF
jgi:DNA-binding PadR family transcriptional regulator